MFSAFSIAVFIAFIDSVDESFLLSASSSIASSFSCCDRKNLKMFFIFFFTWSKTKALIASFIMSVAFTIPLTSCYMNSLTPLDAAFSSGPGGVAPDGGFPTSNLQPSRNANGLQPSKFIPVNVSTNAFHSSFNFISCF